MFLNQTRHRRINHENKSRFSCNCSNDLSSGHHRPFGIQPV
jgi:hypothetical protein